MKKEIRGLPAGIFWADDTARFTVSKRDEGTVLTLYDTDLDICYCIVIDIDGKVIGKSIITSEDAIKQ